MNNSSGNNTVFGGVVMNDTEKILFTTGLSLLSILTIFGNTLVVIAFYTYRPLRTYTNYFIVSLSMSDILVAVISMPVWITFILLNMDFSIFDRKLLKAWTCFDIMTGVASILNLTAVSVDRYIHVTRPLTHSKLITRPRVLCSIILIWVFSCGISLIKGLHWQWEKPNYEMLIFFIGFIMPLAVIVFCYVRIYEAVKEQLSKFVKKTKCLTNERKLKTDVKAIKTIAIVILAFFICWCPFFLLNIWHGWCTFKNEQKEYLCALNKHFITMAKWLHYSNSTINPIIYACFNREFRNGFKIALYKRLMSSGRNSNAFSTIINRTSFRSTFDSIRLANSPRPPIFTRPRSKTFDMEPIVLLRDGINKRHSIAVDNVDNTNENGIKSQFVSKLTNTSVVSELLIPKSI